MRRNITLSIIVVVAAATVVIIIAFFETQSSVIKSSFYGNQLSAKSSYSFKLIQTIPIPNVNGRIDHMDVDILRDQKILFVAEIENNTLDTIDLNAGKRIHSIGNGLLNQPQGVIFIPEFNKIYVSNGQDGSVDIFDAKSFIFVKKIKLSSGDDADNIHYDPNSKLIYVGYGEGALDIINASNGNIVGNIQLAAHPESFQIEEQKKLMQHRIFVNVPTTNAIVVVDSGKRMVSTTWPIINTQNNFPMALDEVNHRLFVGTRDPPKLMVFDTDSGKVISSLNIAKDPDDIFYDAAKKRIYVSCGEGFINIFQQQDANHYNPIASITTAPGARISLFVPELNRFYLAVPHLGNQESEILVYQTA
jgi:DNA-binding beta-propeller fold protein YncE